MPTRHWRAWLCFRAWMALAASASFAFGAAASDKEEALGQGRSTLGRELDVLRPVQRGLVSFGANTVLLVYEGMKEPVFDGSGTAPAEQEMKRVLSGIESQRSYYRQQLRSAHMIGDLAMIVAGGTASVMAPYLVGPAVYATEKLANVVIEQTIGKSLEADLAVYVSAKARQFDATAQMTPQRLGEMGAEERLNYFREHSTLARDLSNGSTDPEIRAFVENSIKRWSTSLETELTRDVDATRDGLAELQRQVVERRKFVDDAVESLNEQMGALAGDVDLLKGKVAAIDGRVDSTIRLLFPRLSADERAATLADKSLVPDAMLCKPRDDCAKVRADMIAFNKQSAASERRLGEVRDAVENLQHVATIASNLGLGNKTFHKALSVATVLGTAYLQSANPLAAAATLSGLFGSGGGSEMGAISAQLAEINQKLDRVLENQRILAGKMDELSEQLRASHVQLDAQLRNLLARARLTQSLIVGGQWEAWASCERLFVDASNSDKSGFVLTFGDFPSGKALANAIEQRDAVDRADECLGKLVSWLAAVRNVDPNYSAQAPWLVHPDDSGWVNILPLPRWATVEGVEVDWTKRLELRNQAARGVIEPYLKKRGLDWSWALDPSVGAVATVPEVLSYLSAAAQASDRCALGYLSSRGAKAYCYGSGNRPVANKDKITRDLAAVIDPRALDGLVRWILAAHRVKAYDAASRLLASANVVPSRSEPAIADEVWYRRALEDLLLYVDVTIASHHLPRSALAAVAIADVAMSGDSPKPDLDEHARLLIEGDPVFAHAVGVAMLYQAYGMQKEGTWSTMRPSTAAYESLMGDIVLKKAFVSERSATLREADARGYGATMFSVAHRFVLEPTTDDRPETLSLQILPAHGVRAAVRTAFPPPDRLEKGLIETAPFIERLVVLRELIFERLSEHEVTAALPADDQTVLAKMIARSRNSNPTTIH